MVRPSRLHWLQGGEVADGRWDAFEAVAGAPITQITSDGDASSWQESRHALLDLCEELASALADGTLPKVLSLAQIWIGRGGRVRLLDAPLLPLGQAFLDGPAFTGEAAERAVLLLRAAVALCARHQLLPTHMQSFADELAVRPAHEETLAWAAGQLRELVKQPVAVGWDDRLGILAVAIGTELTAYMFLGLGLSLLLRGWLNGPIERLAVLVPLLLLLPALFGFLFRGGPAFWLARIHVRRSDGRAASRWRCAWRSFLAWSPIIAFFGAIALSSIKPSADRLQPGSLRFALWNATVTGAVLAGGLLGLVFLIGAVYAVARPQRGLQDELAGTWLAPR
ncbi:MAG TPA: RDD family protein [Pirellulales bacterium]|nr:RDD family protein [Pirellulales bacterium]